MLFRPPPLNLSAAPPPYSTNAKSAAEPRGRRKIRTVKRSFTANRVAKPPQFFGLGLGTEKMKFFSISATAPPPPASYYTGKQFFC
jgi:hypothetical protein